MGEVPLYVTCKPLLIQPTICRFGALVLRIKPTWSLPMPQTCRLTSETGELMHALYHHNFGCQEFLVAKVLHSRCKNGPETQAHKRKRSTRPV